ncbi:MAG: esterase, partial [Epsilonproteobacteria bacterium]
MIIYIHGFGGSGEGVKAKICREYFTDETILTPSLSYVLF